MTMVTNEPARPLKKRAWTKRDQREWLRKIPVMRCEPVQHVDGGHWSWRFWCGFCRAYHHHSPVAGTRSSHCTNPTSPLSTYLLELDPRFKILDRLCRLERREEAARKQRIAERKARAIADELPAADSFPKGGAQ